MNSTDPDALKDTCKAESSFRIYLLCAFVLTFITMPVFISLIGVSYYDPLNESVFITAARSVLPYSIFFSLITYFIVNRIGKFAAGYILYFLFGFMFLFIPGFIFLNGYFDTSAEKSGIFVVTEKKYKYHPGNQKFHLGFQSENGRKCDISVSSSFYSKTKIGDPITLTYKNGYYNMKWCVSYKE